MTKKPLWAVRLDQPDWAPLFLSFHSSEIAAKRAVQKRRKIYQSAAAALRSRKKYQLVVIEL